jgi:integrase
MTLGEFYREFYRPVKLAGCAESTREQYQVALGHWARFAGQVDLESRRVRLDAAFLARFIEYLTSKHSITTANKTMRHIGALLRFADKQGLLPSKLPTWSRLKEPRFLPEAWTADEVQLILAEAIREPGEIDGVPSNRWWYSLLLTIYYCGGRISAVRSTEPADFLIAQRAIILRASNQKQSADQYLHLPDQCIAAVAAIYDSRRKRLWPWPFHRTTLYCRFRGLLRRAGVRYGQGRGGLFGKLRKTHASYMAANGGDASYSLGHSSAAVTRAHYLDPRIVGRGQVDRLPCLRVDSIGDESSGGSQAWLV